MKLIRVGVDLAKNVFQLHGVSRDERMVWRRRLPRDRWLETLLQKLEPGCHSPRLPLRYLGIVSA